jgi:hypothetical protein
LALPACVRAQDANDTPLGDVARSFRKKSVLSESVIDNDNLAKVVDDAETKRAAGASPVFALDPGGNAFHVSSPDVSCSLSFTGKSSPQASDLLLLEDLPRAELAKLDGPATLEGDSLQVSVHNGTSWELREVVIGLTIVQRSEATEGSSYGQVRIVPAITDLLAQPESHPKQPDMMLILKVKGSAAPSATAMFRTALNFALFPDQDWHWAIVKAKGIPPPLAEPTMTQSSKSGEGKGDANSQTPLQTAPLSNVAPANPSMATR